jgi:hypothetical protein
LKWEAIVMFHAAGDGLELEELLKKHPSVSVTGFRKGEPAADHRKHSISGFKVDLGAANSKEKLEERVLKHLQEHSELYTEVAKAGGHASVGIGLMVPAKGPATVTLTPRTLAALVAAAITVHVTGYPSLGEKD